ncbi:MAG: protein kinase [Bryobacteraceae bacterium]|jgi:serine/threonine protein kinase/Flp pilus assembly protein TadD
MSAAASNPSAIRTQLAVLESSSAFRESARHRRLLAFLVETTLKGEADGLKEFVIAAEVWDRDVSFDPRFHSMVRVEVGRLRTRLERYYAGEGAHDDLRFSIPVGGYRVAFESGISGSARSSPAGVPTAAADRFQLVEILGRGGMGEVWKARDTRLDRDVAVKFIADELTHDSAAVELFEREARAAAAISHPNICTVYDIGEREGRPFLAMELLEGDTLKRRLEAGSISADALLTWGIEIADGLEAAHSAGIVHRDLKPANLFITARGQAKILDFGLAKLRREGHQDVAPTGSKTPDVAAISGVAGTPGYMSPEQMRGEKLDARTDLFSFGAVLYEMATGTLPGKALEPASGRNPQVPVELDRIIAKALEEDREVRYQHASDIRGDLKRLKRDSDSGRLPSKSFPAEPRSAAGRRRGWFIAAAALAVAVIAAGVLFYSRSAHKLTGKNVVVLAEFDNTTGDALFDGTLRQGLSAQLEQSPFLSLLSESRIAQTLPLMTQPKDAKLTVALARGVCQRTGSTATIEGSISTLGSQYVLGLRAVNCRNGDLLADEQITAPGKEQVLKALGEAATRLRRRLGESLASVEKYDAPPESVTTGSLEALEAYSLGSHSMYAETNGAAAIPRFEQAIRLDPNFAMAYGRLAVCYSSMGDTVRAAESARKAYELRDRVSDRERFYLASHYEMFNTGNLEAARKTLELWAQNYPRDGAPFSNLEKVYNILGEHEKALAAAKESFRLTPGAAAAYRELVTGYIFLNRLEEAEVAARDAQAHNLDFPILHAYLYQIDFLRHDPEGMRKEAAIVSAKPGYGNLMLDVESYSAASAGQFARARDLTRQAAEGAKRTQNNEDAASYLAEEAMSEALAGNREFAKRQALAALALSKDKGKDIERMAATALGMVGDSSDATRVAADLSKRFPEDTQVGIAKVMIQGAIFLNQGEAGKGIAALSAIAPYDLSGDDTTSSAYERGEAMLAARQGAAAAIQFKGILDHPGVTRNFVAGALAHLGLGRAYALTGDTEKARAAYRDFLVLWKEADADARALRQAKAEFARLR